MRGASSRRSALLLFAVAGLLAATRGAPEGQPFAPGVVLDVTLDSFDAEARARCVPVSRAAESRSLRAATRSSPEVSRRR